MSAWRQQSDVSILGRPAWLILVALGLAFGLVLVLVWRPTRLPVAGLPELARTNLVHLDGRWYQIGHTNPFVGVLLEYYPGGTVMSRSMVSNGQLNGLSEGWFTNRQMQVRETYRTNVADGVRIRWYPNGQKLSEAQIVMGKIQGPFRRWHENGQLAEEIPMHDGQQEGVGRAYYASGSLAMEVERHAGRVVSQKEWKDGEQKAR